MRFYNSIVRVYHVFGFCVLVDVSLYVVFSPLFEMDRKNNIQMQKGEMKMKTKQQKCIKADVKLINKLKDMKNSELQSLNAVVGFLKDEHDNQCNERSEKRNVLEYMLYPQYESKFDKIIDLESWDWLQSVAKKKLDNESDECSETVKAHLKSIVDGNAPFGYKVVEW